jgi:hypothetical protein
MENNNNQQSSYSIESLLQTHLSYHSQNVLKNITFDCAERCLDYDNGVMDAKEEQCVKKCALTYYETFYSSQLN